MNITRGLPCLVAGLLCVALTGCYSPFGSQSNSPSLAPLQTRAIQTRTYDKTSTKEALKTVLNVLQDEGYIIDYGQPELGLLHGIQTQGGAAISYGITTIQEATVNVSEFGEHIKIRINLQNRSVDRNGSVFLVNPYIEPSVYQDFFTKLERAMFIQKQGL